MIDSTIRCALGAFTDSSGGAASLCGDAIASRHPPHGGTVMRRAGEVIAWAIPTHEINGRRQTK